MEDQQSSTRWVPWIAGAVVAALAIAAILSFTSSSEKKGPSGAQTRSEPERGTACAPLQSALQALNEGDDEAVVEAIKTARTRALRSLNEGGILFGKPERAALKLNSGSLETPFSAGARQQILRRLTVADEVCNGLIS